MRIHFGNLLLSQGRIAAIDFNDRGFGFHEVLSSGQDYEADRKRRLGADADTPQRIKYRKLTR